MYIKRAITCRGTFGEWYTENGDFLCYSLERTWRSNMINISCVPDGVYTLIPHRSLRHGDTYALVNRELGVGLHPGEALRSYILIHAANYPSELRGCIAPGTYLTSNPYEWGVFESRNALKKVLAEAAEDRILRLGPYTASFI